LVTAVSVAGTSCGRRAGQTVNLNDIPVGSKNTANPVASSGSSSTSPSSSSARRASPPASSSGKKMGELDLGVGRSGKTAEMHTRDGVRIIGTWYKPENDIQPILILLHVLGRDRHDWDPVAVRLQEAGYGVLSIDFRGHGVSAVKMGRVINWKSFGADEFNNMTSDVQSAVAFVKEQKNVNRNQIAIVGASIGANIALKYASEDPGISAVALLSPGLDYRGVTTTEAMKAYGGRPVFMAASSGDAASAAAIRKLAGLSKGSAEVVNLTGGGHGTEMLMVQPTLIKSITSFLQEAFSKPDVKISSDKTEIATGKRVKGL